MSTDPRQQHIDGSWNAVAAGEAQTPEGPDSIRPPIEGERERIEWEPIPITDLGESAPTQWIWPGFIAVGLVTLFTGLWKSGKSTLIGWLLVNLQRGGGLIPEGGSGIRVLIISEESRTLWCQRRDKLKLDASLEVLCQPLKMRPSAREWQRFVAHITRLVSERGYGLVIFDTISAAWPVAEENDAPQVLAALQPLGAITAAGAGLFLVHHPRKGDAAEGQASRGSGALPSWVDLIVEMRRFAPENPKDRRRLLRAYGRPDDTPPETVLELTDEGYNVIGDTARATQTGRQDGIEGTLRKAGKPLSIDEIKALWVGGMKPGATLLGSDLSAGTTEGRWTRTGSGTKGSPYRYALPEFDSPAVTLLSGSNESQPAEPGRAEDESKVGKAPPRKKSKRVTSGTGDGEVRP